MINLLENKYSILVIRCEDRTRRALLHRYIEQHWPTLGKRSFHHTSLPDKYTTYRQCGECDKWVEVEYSKGWEENNKDESYIGWCGKCGESIIWEPNYDDDYESTIHKKRGNALVVGQSLNNMQPKTHVNHTELSQGEVDLCEEWLEECESYELSVAPKVKRYTMPDGEVREREEVLSFMTHHHDVHNLTKFIEWVCKQVIFQ
jgi:hypothetical protein